MEELRRTANDGKFKISTLVISTETSIEAK